MMKNREIYIKNPATKKLVNEGVANVNDDMSSQALAVLRDELETFVCEGQYEKGMSHILETFLKNIDQAQQPAVWVSGFFGSGKSHFVKMLRALWDNTVFEDEATARGIAELPEKIRDHLKELTTQAKRHGGLHAASGTLGAAASGSVRLALLRIIFKSAGLPEQYPVASFVMWLKEEGIEAQVRGLVEQKDSSWQEELDNFYVSEVLYQSLCEVNPKIFSPNLSAVEILPKLYPPVSDIANEEMLTAIRKALRKNDKFPLTLIVLDEIQQFIGESSDRSIAVQEMVEAIGKNSAGKLMIIGTGQTAVTGTANLARLQGRFTIRVELSDADVDAVIRKVILAKKPEAMEPIEQVMQENLGEISRHLANTTIRHRQDDISHFPQDYPILPVRSRFWENTLRVMDQTGTDSQLRNQLSMVHKVIQTNLDESLGHVVPADYLYFDSADKLLQSRILPRKVYETTMSWRKGSEEEKLMARACGLVFLIDKLGSHNSEIGIRATVDTISDLLVENLFHGSSNLRGSLPRLLNNCELLMKVGDEYRIQTEESVAWNDEFLSQRSALSSETHRIEADRADRIRQRFGEVVNRLSLTQGSPKVPRTILSTFADQLPPNADQHIYVWVRDGWSSDENTMLIDARRVGNQSPTVFLFIPKRSADALRHHLIDYKAASATLDRRGVSNTPEGADARAAMETIKQTANGNIRELLEEAFSGARVFQGGGNEIFGDDLQQMVLEAARNALQRLYPQFDTADHVGWAKVYEGAKKGAPDALKAVGDEGKPENNPVCKAILGFIAGGKKGGDIRSEFESVPYGWSRDAVDGGLQVLLTARLVRAQDERGQPLPPKELERRIISKMMFKVESVTINPAQRIQIRKLYQEAGISAKPNEEAAYADTFLQKMMELADRAGGEAPKPALPDTNFLNEIRLTTGNEQLLALYNRREELNSSYNTWVNLAERIGKRWPKWSDLKQLIAHASGLPNIEAILVQMKTIEEHRRLLEEPDPIAPLVANLTQLLREELNALSRKWNEQWNAEENKLDADTNWQQMEQEQRYELRAKQKLLEVDIPKIVVESTDAILNTLNSISISSLHDRIDAMSKRFDSVANEAAKLVEPKVQEIHLPRHTLKTNEEIDDWVEDVKQQLKAALQNGPIVIR